MTTNQPTISMEAFESSAPKRSRTHKMITIGVATAIAAAAVSALFMRADATTESPAVRTPGVQMTLDQVVHDLAVKGLWPRQALEPRD
jgi:uncharacterized protein YfaA (DUF2138 family)